MIAPSDAGIPDRSDHIAAWFNFSTLLRILISSRILVVQAINSDLVIVHSNMRIRASDINPII